MAPRKKIPGKSHEKDKDPMHCCGGGGDSRGEYLNRLREKAKTNCKLPCTVEGCSTHRDSYSRWCPSHRQLFTTYGTTNDPPQRSLFKEYWPEIRDLLELNPKHPAANQVNKFLRTKALAGSDYAHVYSAWVKNSTPEDFLIKVASVYVLWALDEAHRWIPCSRAMLANVGRMAGCWTPYQGRVGRRPKAIPSYNYKYLGQEIHSQLARVFLGLASAVKRRRAALEQIELAGGAEWDIGIRKREYRDPKTGEPSTLAALCKKYGQSKRTVFYRMKRGWDMRAAFLTPAVPRGNRRHEPKN